MAIRRFIVDMDESMKCRFQFMHGDSIDGLCNYEDSYDDLVCEGNLENRPTWCPLKEEVRDGHTKRILNAPPGDRHVLYIKNIGRTKAYVLQDEYGIMGIRQWIENRKKIEDSRHSHYNTHLDEYIERGGKI